MLYSSLLCHTYACRTTHEGVRSHKTPSVNDPTALLPHPGSATSRMNPTRCMHGLTTLKFTAKAPRRASNIAAAKRIIPSGSSCRLAARAASVDPHPPGACGEWPLYKGVPAAGELHNAVGTCFSCTPLPARLPERCSQTLVNRRSWPMSSCSMPSPSRLRVQKQLVRGLGGRGISTSVNSSGENQCHSSMTPPSIVHHPSTTTCPFTRWAASPLYSQPSSPVLTQSTDHF